MKHLAIITFYMVPSVLFSQSFSLNSHSQGILKTTSGKYDGTIDVNIELDQVLWTKDSNTKIFGAVQVKEVWIKDSKTNQETLYYSLEFNEDHHLFEVLSQGKVTILYHPNLTSNDDHHSENPPFYSLKKGGKATPLNEVKDFMNLLGKDSKWMRQHIKNHHFDLTIKEDIVRTFNYYNGI